MTTLKLGSKTSGRVNDTIEINSAEVQDVLSTLQEHVNLELHPLKQNIV